MKKKIIIAGGTGLLGERLIDLLDNSKYDVYVLSRSRQGTEDGVKYIKWNTEKSYIDPEAIRDTDVIINLAGAGIADKRWTEDRKKVILDSRVNSAETLEKAISSLATKPALYLSASAIGFYGNRGQEILDESSVPGDGFLPDVCAVWEEANAKAAQSCKRHVAMRIGIVLSTTGGALAEILKTTVTGVYGYFGDGSAYYSWIHIDDLCHMMIEAIENDNYRSVYNGTAENPIVIKDLVRAVRKAKKGIGPVVPVPAFALKLAMGEMANMLLASVRAIPKKAVDAGFKFNYSSAEEAVKDLIEKKI